MLDSPHLFYLMCKNWDWYTQDAQDPQHYTPLMIYSHFIVWACVYVLYYNYIYSNHYIYYRYVCISPYTCTHTYTHTCIYIYISTCIDMQYNYRCPSQHESSKRPLSELTDPSFLGTHQEGARRHWSGRPCSSNWTASRSSSRPAPTWTLRRRCGCGVGDLLLWLEQKSWGSLWIFQGVVFASTGWEWAKGPGPRRGDLEQQGRQHISWWWDLIWNLGELVAIRYVYMYICIYEIYITSKKKVRSLDWWDFLRWSWWHALPINSQAKR